MIVHVVEACFRGAGAATNHLMIIVSGTIAELLCFLRFEITLLSELAFVVEVFRVVYVELPLIFRLFDA